MKTHRHTPEQVVRKLRDGDRLLNDGKDLTEVLRTLEISEAAWHRWRAAYGGMKADEAKRLREREKQNQRLKKIVADQALDVDMLKEWRRETSDPGPSPQGRRAPAAPVRVSQRRACRLARQHRSTHRLPTPARPDDEVRLRAELRRIAGAHPRWGWRMAHALLRRDPAGPWCQVNHKRVQRLWREEGLRRPVRTRKRRRVHPDTTDRLRAERANQVWALDFGVRRDRRRATAQTAQHRRRAHPGSAGHAGRPPLDR